MMKSLVLLALLAPAIVGAAPSQPAPTDDGKPYPEAVFEEFTIAPGRQEALIRKLAQWDIVSNAGGQPTTQLYVQEDGGYWDVLLYKPVPKTPVTPEQQKAMDAKADALHLKTGQAFWLEFRRNIATHRETKAAGPISAAQWIARLDAWRASHPEAAKEE